MKIVRLEEFEVQLREVLAFADAAGAEAGEIAAADGNEAVYLADGPDVSEWVEAALRRSLEAELVVAEPAFEGELIDPRDRDLEVAKKALVHLKLPQLRRLAEDNDLEASGKQTELVDRIARAYQEDQAEIARLVLAYEEARPEHGLTDRLYPIGEPVADLGATAATFDGLRGHYIRVGIAKWFVFQEVQADENGLWVSGTMRSYTADAKVESDEFELVSVPMTAAATLRVRQQQQFLEVRSHGSAESRAIITAVQWATKLRRAEAIDFSVAVTEGPMMKWDPRTVFMVYFLDRVFPDAGLDILNLTSARFETLATRETGFTRRPSVKAVTLQGQHLLSSRSACELIAQGRGLVEIRLDARYREAADDSVVLPLKIALDADHVTVLTGFGTQSPETAARLHRQVVQRLRRALIGGVESDPPLTRLAEQIEERAVGSEPVERADIFAPPDDWPDDEDTGTGVQDHPELVH